jgi:hypothetical protein
MKSIGREQDPAFVLGTAEHAARLTEGRHPGVVTAMAWLAFSHLPEQLQQYARPFYQSGAELVTTIRTDSAELTTGLNKLVEGKDWSVRAGIRDTQGKPGPAPRPATVVDPPVGNYGAGQVRPRPIRPRPIRDEPQA